MLSCFLTYSATHCLFPHHTFLSPTNALPLCLSTHLPSHPIYLPTPTHPAPPHQTPLQPLLRLSASSHALPTIYFPCLCLLTPCHSSSFPSLHETQPFRPHTHAHTDASRECLHEHICKSAFGFTGKVTLVLSSVRLVLSAPRCCSV